MNEEYEPINNLWKDSEGYRYFGTLKLSSKIKYNGDDFIPLWEWVEQLKQENERLKEQLEENKLNHKQLKDLEKIQKSFIELKTQQQEFIKYMRELSNWYSADGARQGLVNGILQKYKEITKNKEK